MPRFTSVVRSRSAGVPTFAHGLALAVLLGLLATFPATAAEEAPSSQTIAIHDVRSGDGPCDFLVERTIEGTVRLQPSIDSAGNLVLAIEPVTLHGMLSNPATGKSVELHLIQPNGVLGFGHDNGTMMVSMALEGHFFRCYDPGRTSLTMALPADGAERVIYEAGQLAADPWSHVCGLLAR